MSTINNNIDKVVNELNSVQKIYDNTLTLVSDTTGVLYSVDMKTVKTFMSDSVYIWRDDSSLYGETTIKPNVLNIWENPEFLNIILDIPSTNEIVNEYMLQFTTGDVAPSLYLSAQIEWKNGNPPILEPNKTYQISIINNLGVWAVFE